MKKLGERLSPAAAALLISLLVLSLVSLSGLATSADQSIRSMRSALFAQNVSDDLVIVEMDARSLQDIGQWPWPRKIHAQLIENLSAAGVSQVAMDIDFSSKSNPVWDKEFADAIAKSEANVILATFRQKSSTSSAEYQENLPLPELAANAMLASVNVHPNEDGHIEHYSYAEVTGDQTRPALAALITGSNGELGKRFRIDQAIEPDSFRRLSAVDILNGTFDKSTLEGSTVLIGATAIELGDHYATPHHGILPGVLIHGLAAETLKNGRDMTVLNGYVVCAFTIIVLLLTSPLFKNRSRAAFAFYFPPVTAITLTILDFGGYNFKFFDLEIGLALAFLICHLLTSSIIINFRQIYKEKYSDSRTGLPNSLALVRDAGRRDVRAMAVLQITNYNDIKSVFGSEDLVAIVQSAASRLGIAVQKDDIFRTASDQLAWFAPDMKGESLDGYFETVSTFFLSPFEADDRLVRFQAHCGYSTVDDHDDDMLKTLTDASMAASKAAELGYRWIEFSRDMNDVARMKLTILTDVDQAIENGDIWAAYQPKLDLRSGKIKSMEALARWTHREIGEIGPDRFIPLLEREGRMADLTLYMLRRSLADLEKWALNGNELNCSINISPQLLEDTAFVTTVAELIKDAEIHNSQITLEMTETASVDNLEAVGQVLTTIRDMGIRVSIDDYGTGQSTLSYLRGFPADEIKIDQVFIKSMCQNDRDRVMVGSTIDLAHKMGFSVVAEGVEDAHTLELLKEFGCDAVQGWHVGRPVAAQEFSKNLLEFAPADRASAA